jgi:hypothetical protein
MLYSYRANPVILPPGRAKVWTKPLLTGSTTVTNTIGTVRVACIRKPTVALPVVTITSGAGVTNSATNLRMRSASPAAQRVSIRTLLPSVQPNCASKERRVAGLTFRIVRGRGVQHADPSHPVGLLRARRERPRSRAAEQRDEFAPSHSITSSARKRIDVGNTIPKLLAVFRLMTSSNMVGNSAGSSARSVCPVASNPVGDLVHAGFRSANCRWKAISFHARLRRQRIFLLPFLAAQLPGYEHVGQALRFCLSDLVKMKAAPARTCTALGLELRELGWIEGRGPSPVSRGGLEAP